MATPKPASQTASSTAEVPPLLSEFGTTGLKRSGGQILEEFLPQLSGQRGRKVYREMADNDPIAGGALLALREIVSRLDWHIEPPENPLPEETQQATFLQECLDDMSDSWDVTLSQILSFPVYGWSYHEIVYKVRGGRAAEPTHRSRFADGKIGWRKFAIRSQDTLQEWILDETGGIRGMIQMDPSGGGRRVVPIERALLFRTLEYKGNPEGKSMLRNAYRAWWYKKRLEEIEAVGMERDLAGMPVAFAPSAWFDSQNAQYTANLQQIRDAVTKAKRNEMDGAVFPSIFDDKNNRLLTFELLSSGGTRQVDTDKIIARWNNAMATSMLQDFITLGHEGVGSYALGAAKISLWQLVVESLAKSVAEVINQHAIPRLMRLNGWIPDRMPTLVYGDVTTADLGVLGDFLQKMIDSGVIVPDEEMEGHVRELSGLPQADRRDVAFDNPAALAPTREDPTPAPPVETAPSAPEAPAPPEPTEPVVS